MVRIMYSDGRPAAFQSIGAVHVAGIASSIGHLTDLPLKRDQFVLHATDSQLVLVLHSTKARLELSNIGPDVFGILHDIAHAAPRRSTMAGMTSRVGIDHSNRRLLMPVHVRRAGHGRWLPLRVAST